MTTVQAQTDLRSGKAGAADARAISATLASAFHDDPLFRWMYPEAETRSDLLSVMFGAFADGFLPLGETYIVEGGAGTALWAPPGAGPDADVLQARIAEAAGARPERVFAAVEAVDAHHPEGEHYYLQFVGVRADRQGGGVGSRILAPMLDRCDRESAVAHLDATSPDNKRLYERLGFVATAEYAPAGGPPMWAMRRDPRG